MHVRHLNSKFVLTKEIASKLNSTVTVEVLNFIEQTSSEVFVGFVVRQAEVEVYST